MRSSTGSTSPLVRRERSGVRDGDPLGAGFWPYVTPSGPAAAAPVDAAGRRDPTELDPTHYLFERYSADRRSRPRRLYYLVRTALPRRAQLAMRRAYARAQRPEPSRRSPVTPPVARAHSAPP